MSLRLRTAIPRLLTTLGLMLLLVAAFAAPLGLTDGLFSPSTAVIALVGAGILAIGLWQRRFLRFYVDAATMAANAAVLLLLIEFASLAINRCVGTHRASPDDELSRTKVTRHLYVGWKGSPFQGDAITITDDGLRRTPPTPSSSRQDAIRVFAFGGSTMWGEGARDDETIASRLQAKLAEETGCPVQVTNYGQRAWVATQSMIQLALELERGNVPDVVVFYDGYNEVASAYASGQVGIPANFAGMSDAGDSLRATLVRTAQKTEFGRLLSSLRGHRTHQVEVEPMAQGIVRTYAEIIRLTSALGKEYGFDVRFYWQPQFCTDRKPLTPEERNLSSHPWLPPALKDLTGATYELVRRTAAGRDEWIDLSDCFAGIEERIYLDPCHVVGRGNERVAEAMVASGLRQIVQSRWDDRSRKSTGNETSHPE